MNLRRPLAALVALLATPAVAQTAAPAPAVTQADPALWVVKDADTTIYLFGTIHVLKPGIAWFDDAVKTAFDSSQQLVLEMVAPDTPVMQALVMKLGTAPAGPTLTERLPAKDRPAYAKAVTGLGLPAAAFDRFQPWLAATNLTLLPILKLGYDPANGPETVLTAAAKSAGKTVIGLETAEQQLGYFAKLPENVQVKFLTSTVRDLPKVGPKLTEMVADWSHGQPTALARSMNADMQDTPEVAKVLLLDRNKRWADWIKNRLDQPGVVFVAVGAGHLAGKGSVLEELTKRHVASKRVQY
ncbi:polysaccharide biosynthesis protein GumN [Sphingomonas sp. Leaf357]|uniref:TraB/GumN family protein n=1 Tax=Sphingomonas sp. Leaf357 TaxID=1736350 RepID=UPI00070129DE|nr:TraB/GumN family protein [Sphingomonas sp. Leaf357]KQS02050.1 polysaccharide biosynthesis protein GumN [Sphingomonas sp. Leaf357]